MEKRLDEGELKGKKEEGKLIWGKQDVVAD